MKRNKVLRVCVTEDELIRIISNCVISEFKKLCDKVEVRHKKGSADEDSNNWILYWSNQLNREIPQKIQCPCCNKQTSDIVGAHVIDNRKRTFITPVCRCCNSKAATDNGFRQTPFFVRENDLAELKKRS